MDIKLIRSYRSLCLHRRCLHLFTRLAHFVRSFFRCPVSVTITKTNRPDTRRKSKTFSFVSKQKKKKTTVKWKKKRYYGERERGELSSVELSSWWTSVTLLTKIRSNLAAPFNLFLQSEVPQSGKQLVVSRFFHSEALWVFLSKLLSSYLTTLSGFKISPNQENRIWGLMKVYFAFESTGLCCSSPILGRGPGSIAPL